MNKGRQNQALSKKAAKQKPQSQTNNKKKETAKETAMEVEGTAQQVELELEKPLNHIDETFKALDKISKLLNEGGGKGMSADALKDLEGAVSCVERQLSLEQLHNLQYCSRLSYILDVAARKCPKGKNVSALSKLLEAQILRVESLYDQYFSDYAFLQEIKQKYAGMMAE